MLSLSHQFLAFARSKPAGEEYNASDISNCAIAQFGRDAGFSHLVDCGWVPEPFADPVLGEGMAGAWTWGALADRLEKALSA